ncbi:MAG: hypothetical protein CW338_01130 [Clostridiales bacterium]|nr:hypothetical protein [Clostridiales bacterium]
MAQRTVHMLFAVLLADRTGVRDTDWFYTGSLLPDAYADPAERKTSHFMRTDPSGSRVYFDFRAFEREYAGKIREDGLYLGYYMHLVEDAFYRHYLYYEKDFLNRLPARRLDILHHDYRVLNAFIAEKYPLPGELRLPEGFEKEELNRVTGFDTGRLIRDYRDDLACPEEGEAELLTPRMLEEFADRYLDAAAEELRAVRSGKPLLRAEDYAWDAK